MLTRAMALELGEHGIRVNAVLPGYVDVDEGGRHLGEAYRAVAPFGLPGEPADVARAVLMLASPMAGWVSGSTLAVDGGSGAGRVGARPGVRNAAEPGITPRLPTAQRGLSPSSEFACTRRPIRQRPHAVAEADLGSVAHR